MAQRPKPTIAAACCFRYEPDWLLDQWRQNMGWADHLITINMRDRTEVWTPRNVRVERIRSAAIELGVDWVFIVDPDERVSDRTPDKVRQALNYAPESVHRFSVPMRELWTPTQWRSDGVWDDRWRRRIFKPQDDGDNRGYIYQCEIYHLKMIEPDNRTERAWVHSEHNTWDNSRRGFDYLTDEQDLQLTPAFPYHPPYSPFNFNVKEES